jgi:putative FmdB family regulatory protein
MPIYDYQCKKCGHRFEQLVKAGETPDCPKCGAKKPERFFPFSATVSTPKTREKGLKVARAKYGAQKKEKDHAHQEYLRKEMAEHGEG